MTRLSEFNRRHFLGFKPPVKTMVGFMSNHHLPTECHPNWVPRPFLGQESRVLVSIPSASSASYSPKRLAKLNRRSGSNEQMNMIALVFWCFRLFLILVFSLPNQTQNKWDSFWCFASPTKQIQQNGDKRIGWQAESKRFESDSLMATTFCTSDTTSSAACCAAECAAECGFSRVT